MIVLPSSVPHTPDWSSQASAAAIIATITLLHETKSLGWIIFMDCIRRISLLV